MKNSKMKRLIAAFLSAVVLVTSITPIQLVHAKTELVNVAPEATVIVEGEDTTYGNTKDHLNDKDDTNAWCYPESKWPAKVQLDLKDTGTMVKKVVVKLGGGDVEGRTVDVQVQSAQNGITTDLQEIGTKTDCAMGSDVVFELDQAKTASDIFVTLSNAKLNGSTGVEYWPAIRELEVYEEQDVKLSSYNNIASQATISATGNNEGSSSSNLVDKDDSTLYKFYNGAMDSEQTVTLSYAETRKMDAFRIAFEKVSSTDDGFKFVYSILAKDSDGNSDTIADHVTANRMDQYTQSYQFTEKEYSEIQIVMHSCKSGDNDGWPAIAEFEVYGSEVVVDDSASIAFKKPVHASSGKDQAGYIVDGSKNTKWSGDYYPAYVDIDLEENYYLDTVEIYTPENGYSQYTIYTSMDGRDFDKLAEKTSTDSASLADGEVYQANQKEARIIRVYLEYNSASTNAVINEVRATGTKSGTAVQETPAVNVKDFEDTSYANASMTAQDTYDEVYGIIERRLGAEYKSWFTLELADNPKAGHTYDYFELTNKDGKIHVKGNEGVSLAMGINHYLKYYCNVNISQVGDQVSMPKSIVKLDKTVFKETKAEVRYSYNYCTLSYSMAFWGEDEWRAELDWLALNGVNVVLDATAQEEVWRRFLGKLGYEHEDIKDFIAGPAYYAWAYMANLSGFGGPVHDSWFEERTEMARKNQLSMRRLGMQPVLQGYSGMVPNDIQNYDADVEVIKQGTWCSFQRPDMLVTTSDKFDEYAEMFYECQAEVYGTDNHYYATDPFHEGGNTGGMDATQIAKEVLTSMLEADKDATWIIQAWQGNPSTALLNGLDEVENGASHALVLDLYAEKDPHHGQTGGSYGDTDEFDDTPWLFCMLNNFGGRLGLHGHLDNLANNIPEAFNTRDHIAGIGITPEASVNNPVLYDFIFETVWQDDATKDMEVIDLDEWLNDYATRRYGAESKSAQEAWSILKDTVYKAEYNGLGQGAPESVVNARPALSIGAASTWGNAVISYDKEELEKAAALLLKDYDKLKSSEGYLYDVANVLQQVLSNSAQEYHSKMAAAYNSGNLTEFEKYSKLFLEIIDNMETVTSTSEYFLLGRWVEQAKALADNADDFTKELYEFNAKALVTTWGSYNQAEGGGLKDYSNRQWSGLIGDFYKVRWERWIAERTKELKGESASSINWFQWEWEWVRSNKTYTTKAATVDLATVGAQILEKYSVVDPNATNENDIDPSTMKVETGSYQPDNTTEGDPNYVLDGKTNTIWHTAYGGSSRDDQYLIFTLEDVTEIDSMRFLQRSGTNGFVTKYSLYVREKESDQWSPVLENAEMEDTTSWQRITFKTVKAKQIKFQVVDAKSTSNTMFAAAAEVRFTTPQKECTTHVYGEWTVSKAATCTEQGEEKRVCTVCGKGEETRKTKALGHEYSKDFTVDTAASCKAEGSKSRHCTRTDCNAKTDVTVIKKLAHVYGEWTVETEPDCTNAGGEKRICTVCKTEETRAIAAKGHKLGDWGLVEPSTELYTGKMVRSCENCRYEEVRAREYKVLEGGSGVYDYQASTSGDGSYTLRFAGNYADFKELRINGKVVDKKYYKVWEGSTYVQLFKTYMDTLADQTTHTVKAVYEVDGVEAFAETTITVAKAKPSASVGSSSRGDSGKKTYEFITGADDSYNKNTDSGHTLRIDADLDKFTGVKLDGRKIENGSYITWSGSGSAYVKFTKDFMDGLALGEHAIIVQFTDGTAATTVKVVAYDVPEADLVEVVNVSQTTTDGTAPKTGDSSNVVLWTLLLGACSGTLIFANTKKRKEDDIA